MPLRTTVLVTLAVISLDLSTAAAQDVTSEKGKLSYAVGYKTGIDVARLIERGETVDMASIIKGLQDAAAKRDPAVPADQLGQAMDNLQRRLAAKAKADFDKLAADNKTKSEAFLAQYRQRPGVKAQPSGVLYRQIAAGTGSRPTLESTVRIAHKGTKPDGTVIVDTDLAYPGQPAGPVELRLKEVPLEGLREALLLMTPGARLEVAIPGALAYGTGTEAGEMANQAVLFDVRLLQVR